MTTDMHTHGINQEERYVVSGNETGYRQAVSPRCENRYYRTLPHAHDVPHRQIVQILVDSSAAFDTGRGATKVLKAIKIRDEGDDE